MAPNRSGQIKQAVKHSVSGFVGSGWSFRSLRAFNRERLLILCYHRVIHESDAGRVNISDMFSDLDSFTVQMDFISRHYAPVSEQDIIDALAGRRKLPDFSAWVTFDDGYRDNFTLAYPILKKFSIPATFFISPGLIDRDAAAMVELRKTVGIGPEEATDYFMNWEQIRELSAQGYSIGSHTCTHRILSTLNACEVEEEIVMSKRLIEQRIQSPVRSFAYPRGKRMDYVPGVCVPALKRAGYAIAVSTRGGNNDRSAIQAQYELRRVGTSYQEPLGFFKLKVSSGSPWQI